PQNFKPESLFVLFFWDGVKAVCTYLFSIKRYFDVAVFAMSKTRNRCGGLTRCRGKSAALINMNPVYRIDVGTGSHF
ncbi:MAG: hypothetical protein ACOVOD_12535, partial [Rhodoferax sp.]